MATMEEMNGGGLVAEAEAEEAAVEAADEALDNFKSSQVVLALMHYLLAQLGRGGTNLEN